MRKTLLSILSACLLGFVPGRRAASPAVSSLGYPYNVQADWSPFIQKKSVEASLSLYSSTGKPFYVSFFVYVGETLLTLKEQTVSFSGTETTVSFTYEEAYTQSNRIKLGFSASVYDTGPYHAILLYSKSKVIDEQLRVKDDYIEVRESGTYECPELYLRMNYDGVSPSDVRYRRKYAFQNADYVKDSGKRSMGLTDYVISLDEGGSPASISGLCFLRALDHKKDFPLMADMGGYAEKMVMLKAKNAVLMEYSLGFYPALFYDKFKLEMCQSTSTDYGFSSNELFIPLGLGHDNDDYSFSLILTLNKTDAFVVQRKAITSSLHFGPCGESDYCVIGDMDA